jgi:ribonucleotide reductase beta subunit family protein with ferritin-like domain
LEDDAVNDTHSAFHRTLTVEIPAELDLYEKLKAYQWNASTEIDWSRPIQNFSEASYQAVKRHVSRDDYDRLRAQQRAFTFTQLFLGEQAALALCAQLLNMVPEMETKFCLAGQIIDEARHVEVFGRYLEKLGAEAPINRPLEELVHRLLESDHYGEKIVGMQIFLEGIAVGIFQRFQHDSPDPLMRDILRLVLRDESRHAGFGVIYLADRFRNVSPAERLRVERFVGRLWRLFRDATASPFGPLDAFLEDTFADIAHRLKLIGLDLR